MNKSQFKDPLINTGEVSSIGSVLESSDQYVKPCTGVTLFAAVKKPVMLSYIVRVVY